MGALGLGTLSTFPYTPTCLEAQRARVRHHTLEGRLLLCTGMTRGRKESQVHGPLPGPGGSASGRQRSVTSPRRAVGAQVAARPFQCIGSIAG